MYRLRTMVRSTLARRGGARAAVALVLAVVTAAAGLSAGVVWMASSAEAAVIDGGILAPGVETTLTLGSTDEVRYKIPVPGGARLTVTVSRASTTAAFLGVASGIVLQETRVGPLGDWFTDYTPVATATDYTVVLRADGAGTLVFTPRWVTDVPAVALRTGTPATIRIADPGQQALLTVPAVPGSPLTLATSNLQLSQPSTPDFSHPAGFVMYARQDPNDFWSEIRDGGDGTYRSLTPASSTTAWTVRIDPVRDVVGTLDVVIPGTPVVDVRADLVLNQAVTATTTTPGQKIVFAVPAMPGPLPPAFRLSGVTLTGADGVAPHASASIVQSTTCSEDLGPITFTTKALRARTTSCDYSRPTQLLVETDTVTTVKLTVTLVQPKLTTLSVTPGRPIPLTFAQPGDTFALTVATNGSGRVVTRTSGLTVPGIAVSLTQSGTSFSHVDGAGTDGKYDEFVPAPAAGKATLTVTSASGIDRGAAVLTVHLATDPTIAATARTVTRVAWTPGQNPRVTVNASAGQRVVMQVVNTSKTNWTTVDVDVDGTAAPVVRPGDHTFVAAEPVKTAGVKNIAFNPAGTGTGWIDVRITLVTDVQKHLTLNQPLTVKIAQPGQNARLEVAIPDGTTVDWAVQDSTVRMLDLRLVGPNGLVTHADAIPKGTYGDSRWAMNLAAGTYYVEVDPVGSATGSLTFRMRGFGPA